MFGRDAKNPQAIKEDSLAFTGDKRFVVQPAENACLSLHRQCRTKAPSGVMLEAAQITDEAPSPP